VRESAITNQHLAAADRDYRVVLGVLSVEMGWFVIVEVHRDRDAVGEADPGHLVITAGAWDGSVESAHPADTGRQMSTIVVGWRITSEGDPSSVAPAACCASRTSCLRRRRPNADGVVATRCCTSCAPRTTLGSREHPVASRPPPSASALHQAQQRCPHDHGVCATYGPLHCLKMAHSQPERTQSVRRRVSGQARK
jgi:hypothetical protein